MYPLGVYLFIGVIDAAVTIYSISSKGTQYYKDLIALGIATFLTVYLAIAAVSGTVIISDGHAITSFDDGLGNTTTAYTTPVVMQDDGLMWIGIIVAAIQGLFLLFEIVETVEDYYAQKAENLIS